MDNPPSPYQPDPSSVSSASPRGGRLNELLNLGRSRAVSADSYAAASHSSQSSESSGGSSTVTTPEEAEVADEGRTALSTGTGTMRQLVRAGQLRKRSPRGLQLWQSRYCWLYSDSLQYSKTRDSRAMQGSIPLTSIRHVQAAKANHAATGGSAADKQKRRFDVLISAAPEDGSNSGGRTFHFEASTEHDADEWVIALTQACRKATSSGAATDSRRPTSAGEGDKFWKTNPIRMSGGRLTVAAAGLPPQHPSLSASSRGVSLSAVARPSSAERRRTEGAAVVQQAMSRVGQPSYGPSSVSVSHWSINSNSPSSMSAVSGTPGTISPVRAPTVHGDLPPSLLTAFNPSDSPVSASSSYSLMSIPSMLPSTAGSLTLSRYSDDRSSPPLPATYVPAMLDVVQRIEFHPIGDWFLCRDKASTTDGSWYLMHATHRSHPLFPAVHTATIGTPTFTESEPYMLQRLAAFTSADAVFALYTPAFRPADTLLSYLHTHRRLPEPVVRYVAVHVIRAILSLHAASLSYPLLSPASLAFDGEATVYLIDPIPGLSSGPQLPEYQLHGGEHEGGRADWWRLGVLLYELAVGFPPVRADEGDVDEWTGVAQQLQRFHPMTLPFPPFVPAGLQSLIRQLLMTELDDRLGCGELSDTEVTQHPYFDGVQWTADTHDSITSPPWVRQHVLKQQLRISLTTRNATAAPLSTGSSGASSTASTPLHVTRPHASSTFTFSPVSTPPGTERHLFFPSTLQLGSLSPIDAYMQQLKPPRHLLRLPSASSLTSSPSAASLRPSSLHLTLLGGRGFPPAKDDEAASSATSSLQRIKRRTLGERGIGALKDAAGSQQGVYVAVQCVGEEEADMSQPRVRVSRLVVGPAACQPSFGDSFLFALPGDDQRLDSVELSLEIRHTRVGSPLTSDSGAVGQLVGSVSVPVRSIQSAVTASDEIWHSVISSQGLVVGEVHVKYAFTYEQTAETIRRQWWTAAEMQYDSTFEALFGVQLTTAPGEGASMDEDAADDGAGYHQLSVVVEAGEDLSRQQSVCLPTGNEARLSLDASALENDNAALPIEPTAALHPNELFEPQERVAVADLLGGTTATLLTTRPTGADVQLLRSVLCDSKQRAEHSGISVDLSPITSQLIAFASPVTIPALTAYRNPLSHIQLYLQAAYPASTSPSATDRGASIRIYNLNTDSSAALIPSLGSSSLSFAATGVPAFDVLLHWCADVQTWLSGGEGRVVAVHCLSGVWRCCVVVCAYLLFDGQVATVADAVALFCRQRLTPAAAASFMLLSSHRRWLQYVERHVSKMRRASFTSLHPPPSLGLVPRTLQLTHVRLSGLSTSVTNPLWGGHDHTLWYVIVHSTANVVLYDSRVLGTTAAIRERGGSSGGRDVITSGCEVSGEWRLSVCCEAEVRVSCWLHPSFVGDDCYVKLRRDELDWPAGSYKGKRAGSSSVMEDVSVECFFTAV